MARRPVGSFLVFSLLAAVRVGAAPVAVERVAWMDDYTLVQLQSGADARAAIDEIRLRNGRVAIIASPQVLLGWIPAGADRDLAGRAGIVSIHRAPVDENGFLDTASHAAARAFNWMVRGDAAADVLAADRQRGQPLTGDAFARPPEGHYSFEKILATQVVQVFPPARPDAGCGNSEIMTGIVAISIFFVESNGGVDPNLYTWTPQHQTDTYNRAIAGLSWWSSMAPAHGASVIFSPNVHWASDPVCLQPYEPILHSAGEDNLWISSIMSNVGAASVEALNSSVRAGTGADWAYSLFIAYNPSGAPSTFTDGYFAYAYLGGPYSQLCYNNDGWGAGNFGNVLAHESAHIFWADDEYFQPGYGGCTSCGAYGNCPRPSASNGNCEFCNAKSVSCIMRDGTPAYGLCPYTPDQIGWNGGSGGGQADLTGSWSRVKRGGNAVKATLNVQNRGSGGTGAFFASVYFSRSGGLGDAVHAEDVAVSGVAAGSESSVRIRTSRPGRSYRYIFAVIDSGAAVSESNEVNNTAAALIP